MKTNYLQELMLILEDDILLSNDSITKIKALRQKMEEIYSLEKK